MPGIREQQCAEFDGKDIGIHGVPSVGTRWVPKFSGIAENERLEEMNEFTKLFLNFIIDVYFIVVSLILRRFTN